VKRRTTKAVTRAFSPITFGVPMASAIRSAAAPPEIGGQGSAARIASASSASTAARDHRGRTPLSPWTGHDHVRTSSTSARVSALLNPARRAMHARPVRPSLESVKVFVSSVQRGLQAERDYLRTLLRAADYEVLAFEDFTAQSMSSREACLQAVQEADVYVLLLGEKYGEPMDDSGRSPTEEEFTVAYQRGIPILVFRKDGGEREPAQAAFERRVGDYKVGRFWKDFTDAQSLGPSVVAALRELQSQPTALTWSPLPSPLEVLWRAERPLPAGQRLSDPVLEAHVLPANPVSTLMPVGALSGLADRLAAQGRSLGLFTHSDPLSRGHDSESAWAVRLSERQHGGGFTSRTLDPYAGLVVDRAGSALAFHALPTDGFGAVVDHHDLQQRLTPLLLALVPHIPDGTDEVALVAAIDVLDRVFEGDPGQVGNRTQGSMRMASGQAARAQPQDCVPVSGLVGAPADAASELAARLIYGVRAAGM
jgi:hypothetical protein